MSDSEKSFLPDQFIQQIKKHDTSGMGVFPPNVFKMVPFEFLEYKKGKSIRCRFIITSEYDNPFGITFGGIFGMFFDSVFGPFSGLESNGPTSSLDMNITFIKSISTKDEFVDVTATISASTKSFFLVKGEMHNKGGQLVATATSRMMVMDVSRMKSLKR